MKEHPILFTDFMVQANHTGRKRMTRRVVALDRLKVVMRREVRSDLPAFIRPSLVASKGAKLPATLNPHGAVSCLIDGRALGLKPGEFGFVCPYAQGETVMVREGEKNTWTIIPHESRVWVRECCKYEDIFYKGNDLTAECFRARIEYRVDGSVIERDVAIEHWTCGCEVGTDRWRPSIHMPRWACRDVYTVTKVRLERLHNLSEADVIAEGVESVGRDPEGTILYRNYFDDGYAWSAEESFMTLWYSLYGFKGPNAWDRNPWVWVIEYDNPLWVQP